MPAARAFDAFDRLLIEAQRALGSIAGQPVAERLNPAADTAEVVLTSPSAATPPA